jgi:hypothetical protein
MTVRGGGVPCRAMAFVPPLRMGPPPRSLAADAHACIMVWSDPPDTRLRHERPRAGQRAPLELHPDHHQLAGVLGAVKMRPGNGREWGNA